MNKRILKQVAWTAAGCTLIAQFAGAQTFSRTDITTYRDDTVNWVLDQVESRSSTGVMPGSTAAVQTDRTEFDSRGLPWKIFRFGKLRQTITYNADGTIATVADGNNHTTTLSNWKRGVPQLITFADRTTKSAQVNDDGTIAWVKDETGARTCYGYDAMGRLNLITYPSESTAGACGTDKWAPTTVAYAQIAGDEYGIAAGHWRRLEQTGNYRKLTYYDALLRPIVNEEADTSDTGSTTRWTATQYDQSGRVKSVSYPRNPLQQGPALWNAALPGTRTIHDALGRVSQVDQDSELGVLSTTTEYLSGLRVRVTNPRRKVTTNTYQALEHPSYEQLVRSDMPEGAIAEITRNSLGMPFAITRRSSNGTVSSTRRYVYDTAPGAGMVLCKTIEPETGATVNHYDGANNLLWSAAGLNLPNPSSCDGATAAASARVVARIYDARNRLRTLSFPDGNGDQDWTYWNDGLPRTVTTWNDQGATTIVNAYTYNARRLLTGETQTSDAYSWSVGYGYNSLAHRESLVYPAGLTLT